MGGRRDGGGAGQQRGAAAAPLRPGQLGAVPVRPPGRLRSAAGGASGCQAVQVAGGPLPCREGRAAASVAVGAGPRPWVALRRGARARAPGVRAPAGRGEGPRLCSPPGGNGGQSQAPLPR